MRELDKIEVVTEQCSNHVVMLLRYHKTLLEREHIKYNFRRNFCEKANVEREFGCKNAFLGELKRGGNTQYNVFRIIAKFNL